MCKKIFHCAAREQQGSPRANCPKGSGRRCVQLALPTGPSEVSEINDLELGLGKEPVTEFQSVSAMAPKPFQ
jgi:hypothetical protein